MVDPIELRLGAPDDAKVTELAIQIAKRDLGVVAGERAARALAARAQVNPLYLTELIKLARVNGLRLMDDDIPEIQDLPGDAHSLFQREWADYLSVGTRHLLTAAAIVGTPVHETVALAAANALPHSGKVQRLAWCSPQSAASGGDGTNGLAAAAARRAGGTITLPVARARPGTPSVAQATYAD
jgi:hypothetical protein